MAISTIHAVLDRHGLVKRRKRRRHKAMDTTLAAAHDPNGLWCADYKGEFMLGNKQYCYPLRCIPDTIGNAADAHRRAELPASNVVVEFGTGD